MSFSTPTPPSFASHLHIDIRRLPCLIGWCCDRYCAFFSFWPHGVCVWRTLKDDSVGWLSKKKKNQQQQSVEHRHFFIAIHCQFVLIGAIGCEYRAWSLLNKVNAALGLCSASFTVGMQSKRVHTTQYKGHSLLWHVLNRLNRVTNTTHKHKTEKGNNTMDTGHWTMYNFLGVCLCVTSSSLLHGTVVHWVC